MTPEEEQMTLIMQKQLESEQLRRMTAENNASRSSAFSGPKDPNLMQEQLDLTDILDRIHHLLSGHVIVRDFEGNEIWAEPNDDRLKILSDYGVKQIMNIIQFYINKNTLLSNYDEETIYWKVRDFGIELTDLIFNRYEMFFYYPKPEELLETYLPIAKSQGMTFTEEELYFKCCQWSKAELQSKLRHFPMIVLSLIDSVHSTFLRALGGEERTSLRKQYQIHQSLSGNMMPETSMPTKFKITQPSTWPK